MEKDFLLDNWQKTGNDIEDFKDIIKQIAEQTNFVKINSKELTVLSYHGKTEDGKLEFVEFNPIRVHNDNGAIAPHQFLRIAPRAILSKGDFENLINEVTNDVGLLFYNGIKCMFVSKKVLTTKLLPFGINGDFLSEKSYARDLLIAKLFGSKALFRTLVTREENGITKVFSILGERYKSLSQDILVTIYEALTKGDLMGSPACNHWEITHFMSNIRIEFPDKADEFQTLYGLPDKLVPGIILETSDTGDCSIRVKGFWRVKNSISLHSEVSKKHIGRLDIDNLLEEVNNSIFSEYTMFPEALCDLMSKNVSDPSWDLSTASGRSKNNKKIETILKHAFKHLKVVEAIGKQAEMALYEQLLYEFDDSIAYTAYDFAVAIMSLPERVIGLHPLTQEKLAKAVSKAPYIKYEAKDETSAIILTA